MLLLMHTSGTPQAFCGHLIFQHDNFSLHFTFLYSRTVQALEMLTPVTVLAGSPEELRTVHSYVES